MGLIVDIHAHAVVPDAQLLVRRERAATGATGASVDPDLPASAWQHGLVDLDTRLAAMDDAGIDVQAVRAVSWQFHYWAGRSLAAELVDKINARLAALARQAPDRLVGVATVALQHPDLAAEQLRHAVDDYDFRGVQIATSAGGRTLSHRALDPFWSMAELLGIPVLVHPRECGGQTRSPVDLADPALELVRVLSDLVSGGVMDRFPALAVCATPAGGSFPHPADLAGRSIGRPHDEHVVCHDLATGRHLYVDTLVGGDDASLNHLVDCLGADHVLMGTGYPFNSTVGQPLNSLDPLPRGQRDRMSGGNARDLLRLRAPD